MYVLLWGKTLESRDSAVKHAPPVKLEDEESWNHQSYILHSTKYFIACALKQTIMHLSSGDSVITLKAIVLEDRTNKSMMSSTEGGNSQTIIAMRKILK